MVRDGLLGFAVVEGLALLEALDQSHLPVETAWYYYLGDEAGWHLYLVLSTVAEKGRFYVYRRIGLELPEEPGLLVLNEITVLAPDDERAATPQRNFDRNKMCILREEAHHHGED